MIDRRDEAPPDVQALLDRERDIPPVPAAVRTRALARARAAIAAGPPARAALTRTPPSQLRWAAVAVVLLVASAAAGAAVYEFRAHLALRRAAPPVVLRTALVEPAAHRPPAVAQQDPQEDLTPSPAAPPRAAVNGSAAELRLLALARAAVARGDYAAALPPIAEHARRFKNGRLAEEREALRVRALAGLGRTDEARRAAHRFEARFPRSVLLPAVQQMSASAP